MSINSNSSAHRPRSYVTGKGSIKRTTKKHKILLNVTFTEVRFTRDDLLPFEFWEANAGQPPLGTPDLTAEECYETVRDYVDVAIADPPGWRDRFITNRPPTPASSMTTGTGTGTGTGSSSSISISKKMKTMRKMSAYTLHYIATMIAMRRPGDAMHIAIHIFSTLSERGYTPSVLSFARMALDKRLAHKPQFEPVVDKFMQMTKRIGLGLDDGDRDNNKSPADNNKTAAAAAVSTSSLPDFAADACTLRAMYYATDGTHEGDSNALRWFRRAYEIATAVEGRRSGRSPFPPQQQPPSSPQPQPQNQNDDTSSISTPDSDPDPDPDLEIPPVQFDPNWQWKHSFCLGVAAIRARRGEYEKALAMCRLALSSADLDSAEANRTTAVLLQQMGRADADTAEYETCLLKAAVSGDKVAAAMLAEHENKKLLRDAGSRTTTTDATAPASDNTDATVSTPTEQEKQQQQEQQKGDKGPSEWDLKMRRVIVEELMAIADA